MSRSGWTKHTVLVVITALSPLAVSCASADTVDTAAPSTTVNTVDRSESPAAPVGQLATAGTHCFRTPVDVAAAAGRIGAYNEKAAREYESARRGADAGGPLPPFGAGMLGEVSDPDANNCILVSTYRYEDRYWWPPVAE